LDAQVTLFLVILCLFSIHNAAVFGDLLPLIVVVKNRLPLGANVVPTSRLSVLP
jgi:hypothetical protein